MAEMTLTAEQWRPALDRELTARLPRIDLYENYYVGNHRMAFATSKFREAFGELFEAFATNWCGLVVDVAVERDEADDDAWEICPACKYPLPPGVRWHCPKCGWAADQEQVAMPHAAADPACPGPDGSGL